MNGQDINGWFIGFIESQNNTYFFSTNIQSEQRATGSKASDGALSTRIDSSHKYKHLPTLQELTYTPILAVFQKSLLTAIPLNILFRCNTILLFHFSCFSLIRYFANPDFPCASSVKFFIEPAYRNRPLCIIAS